MNEDIQLRPAQPNDAERASALLYSAYNHRQVPYPLPEETENRFGERLQHFFREQGNRFSYQYIQVAEHRSEVVGLVLSFGGRDEERLNAAIGWRLEHEANDDEWYVDALAVFTNWGRKGIGTRLLQAAEQQGRQQHYHKIALNVAQENEQALSLYQHLHYISTQKTLIYHQPHLRMVKSLENGS
ncbi:GNAT family N-acetyltransferase [Dictyobacter kobayashii]|uniref:N-acetyltransferase n=1 Tax=Dictyobacter kobayashii TaxID=2014872 RepID=A0A402ASX1_9CHLR|nr:GNAT family N-acetyltransferase [Dictyobacter kobayashii]GCE22143.1 N-acetyltransferase [Dictyobacter kobayashii]